MDGHQHKIVKSGFYSVLQIAVSSISYVFIYALVISRLGKEQLGVWSIITAIPAVVSFLGSGVSGSLLRYVPLYFAKKEKENIHKIIYNGLLFNLALGAVLVFIAFAFETNILKFMFGMEEIPAYYKELFNCALLTFLLNFLSSVFLSALDGIQQIVLKNKILIFCTILFCAVASLLIFKYNLPGLLYAQIFQAIMVIVLTFFTLLRLRLFKLNFYDIDFSVLSLFYRYGGKLQYVSLLNILFEPATKYFLNKYFNLGAVGTYDLVNRIVVQLRTLIVNAIQVIVPFVASVDEASPTVLKIYAKSLKGALLLSSILFGGLISGGFSIVYLFTKINATEFQVIMLYLVIGYLINILSTPAYAIRLAMGKLNYLIVAQLLSTGINILLFLVLGKYLNLSTMLLPTCLAVGISSAYIILTYQLTLKKTALVFDRQDSYIYIASLLFPIICIIVSRCFFHINTLLGIVFLHALLMMFLIYKNEYLRNVIHILVKKEQKEIHD